MFYVSLAVEIFRIERTTADSNNFKSSCKSLISRMITQGAKFKSIEQYLYKFYGRNFGAFVKFANTYVNFINYLVPPKYFVTLS